MKHILTKDCQQSAVGFIKIRLPALEHGGKGAGVVQQVDLLDQTRIHPENYHLALKIANDIEYDNVQTDKFQQYMAVKSVLMKPSKIKSLGLE